MKQFSEATRVQMPTMVHLTRLGYKYFGKLSEDMSGIVYDGDTNILLQVFETQSVDLVRTGKQQTVDPVGLRTIARPHTSASLVGFLIPVAQPDKNVHALAYHLPVPGVFKLDKILFG